MAETESQVNVIALGCSSNIENPGKRNQRQINSKQIEVAQEKEHAKTHVMFCELRKTCTDIVWNLEESTVSERW